MAVKALGKWAEKDRRLSGVIEGYMKMARISATNLSKRTGKCFSTHYNRLKEPEKMTIEELRIYIDVLKLPEEEILDALYLHRERKSEK